MNKKKTILIVCSVAAVFAAGVLVYVLTHKPTDDIKVADYTPKVEETTAPVVTEPEETTVYYPPFVNGLSLRAQEAYQSNPDTIGWIRISNTVIDYPLVKGKDNDFYVNHNFDKQPQDAGWVFMDYRNDFGPDYFSDNILTYGHNMANGTMFSDIKKYQRNVEFYEANPIIEVSSLYADYQYKVFAFMRCNGMKGSDFEFWNYTMFNPNPDDPWSLETYLAKIDEKSLITTNVDVKKGDKLLLLSTCDDGDTENPTRFVVLARKVRPGEDALEGTKGSVRRDQ